jgi:hypothetical protein
LRVLRFCCCWNWPAWRISGAWSEQVRSPLRICKNWTAWFNRIMKRSKKTNMAPFSLLKWNKFELFGTQWREWYPDIQP